MDPNDPNNQSQGGVPPLDAGDPTPDQLTPDALYGPSTPADTTPAPVAPIEPLASTTSNDLYGTPTAADPAAVPQDTLAGPTMPEPPVDASAYYQDPAPVDPNAGYDPNGAMDMPPSDQVAPDLTNPYYEEPVADPSVEYAQPAGEQPPPPPVEASPASGLPPIPTKSKLPLILIVLAGVVVLGIVLAFVVFSMNRSRNSQNNAPTATEEPLSCEEDPTQSGCESENLQQATPEPTTEATPEPTAATRTPKSPQECQIIFGGPCPPGY